MKSVTHIISPTHPRGRGHVPGWGSVLSPACEAAVLSECGEVASAEGDLVLAADIFGLALAVCPSHLPAMLAAANLHLVLRERSSGDGGSGVNRHQAATAAYELAKRAVETQPCCDTWCVL